MLEFARDLLGQLGAALVEHVLEGLQARLQHVLDRLAAAVERGCQRLGVVAEGFRHRIAAGDHGVGDALAGLLQLGDDVAAAQRKIEHQRVAGRAQRGVHLVGAGRDGFGHARAGIGQGLGEVLRAARHVFHGAGRLLGEALRHGVEPRRHHLLQADGELGEFVVHVVGLEVEAVGQPLARRADRRGRAFAGGFEPVEQGRAALGQRIDHGIAGVAERERDVLALLGERAGDALRHFVDLLGHQIADRGDVVREVEMHAADGVAHLFGLIDQGLALVGQLADQIADAHFVIVIGALERGHFVVHQRFQLGGTRKRALDAVAHGGDFAADGLADRHDRLARHRFRLRQPHRHLGHGFGDQPQLLRAAEHVGEHEEEDDRDRERGGKGGERGKAGARTCKGALQLGAEQQGAGQPAGDPDGGRDAGDHIGQAGRLAVQRLQDRADRGAVVIGGAARRAFGGLLVREEVGGDGRCLALLAQAERLLDGGERLFGGVLGLLRNIRHFGRRLVVTPAQSTRPERPNRAGRATSAGSGTGLIAHAGRARAAAVG